MSTLLTLRGRVRTFLNEPSAGYWADTEISRWLVEAQQRFARLTLWFEKLFATINSVSGTKTYGVPADCYVITRLTYDGYKMKQISWREYEAVVGGQDSTSTGTPAYWWRWQDNIYFHPIPDASNKAIKVYGYTHPALMSLDTDSSGMPDEYEDCLIYYVVWQAKLKDEDYGAAHEWRGMFYETVERAKIDKVERDVASGYPTILDEQETLMTERGVA